MKSGIKILLATSALAACVPTSALAQVDDEIIITATRRAESIQDVPIAVTAILPETIQKQGVVNIQNLTSVAPSFSTSNAQIASGSVVLRIRGVGTTSNNIGFESAVGVFIDGAYQSRPGVALGEFVDVERVEVLRGPQGTLFGRNTPAGLVKIDSARPTQDFEGWVQERGLYFAGEWDKKYETVIAWNDPGEDSQEGSILVADYGEGHFIFTGISFFRQLPAGVPGAYRLMTNMISYGK